MARKHGKTFRIHFIAVNPGQSWINGLLVYYYYGTTDGAKDKAKMLMSRIPNVRTDATITRVSVGEMKYGDFPIKDGKVVQ